MLIKFSSCVSSAFPFPRPDLCPDRLLFPRQRRQRWRRRMQRSPLSNIEDAQVQGEQRNIPACIIGFLDWSSLTNEEEDAIQPAIQIMKLPFQLTEQLLVPFNNSCLKKHRSFRPRSVDSSRIPVSVISSSEGAGEWWWRQGRQNRAESCQGNTTLRLRFFYLFFSWQKCGQNLVLQIEKKAHASYFRKQDS